MQLVSGTAHLPQTADFGAAFFEAERTAQRFNRAMGSADVIVGVMRAGGAAARLLGDRGLELERLEPIVNKAVPEAGFNASVLAQAAGDIAIQVGARSVSSLHLLLATLRDGRGAMELLRLTGQDPARLRGALMRSLTGPTPLDERMVSRGANSSTRNGPVGSPGPVGGGQHSRPPGHEQGADDEGLASVEIDLDMDSPTGSPLPVAPQPRRDLDETGPLQPQRRSKMEYPPAAFTAEAEARLAHTAPRRYLRYRRHQNP